MLVFRLKVIKIYIFNHFGYLTSVAKINIKYFKEKTKRSILRIQIVMYTVIEQNISKINLYILILKKILFLKK